MIKWNEKSPWICRVWYIFEHENVDDFRFWQFLLKWNRWATYIKYWLLYSSSLRGESIEMFEIERKMMIRFNHARDVVSRAKRKDNRWKCSASYFSSTFPYWQMKALNRHIAQALPLSLIKFLLQSLLVFVILFMMIVFPNGRWPYYSFEPDIHHPLEWLMMIIMIF